MPIAQADVRAQAQHAQTHRADSQVAHTNRVRTKMAIATIAMTLAALVPHAVTPAPALAGSCTGWTSKSVPPPVIRVLRTAKGKVQVVNFRRYVAVVMASGEWPSRHRPATLKAGAIAVKQYAWYYTLKGNHRPGYSKNGRCYDVRDDTNDQLFRPERASPTAKQQRAINATWALTLRKNGRFFLTGYRAGSASRCGADANGWKLYEKSVEDCARRGWSLERIQRRYYAPNLSVVKSTHLGPPLKRPRVILRPGTTVAAGAATISWRPVSSRLNVASYHLQRKVGSGRWRKVPLSDPTATSATVKVRLGKTNRFRVYAKDSKGRRGPWAYSQRRKARLRGPVGTRLSGASVNQADGGPTSVRIAFSGHSIALVAPTAPGMGRVKIFIGGKWRATVDLDSKSTADRKLVWARNFGRVKRRSVRIRPIDPNARVDFEGFLVLR